MRKYRRKEASGRRSIDRKWKNLFASISNELVHARVCVIYIFQAPTRCSLSMQRELLIIFNNDETLRRKQVVSWESFRREFGIVSIAAGGNPRSADRIYMTSAAMNFLPNGSARRVRRSLHCLIPLTLMRYVHFAILARRSFAIIYVTHTWSERDDDDDDDEATSL